MSKTDEELRPPLLTVERVWQLAYTFMRNRGVPEDGIWARYPEKRCSPAWHFFLFAEKPNVVGKSGHNMYKQYSIEVTDLENVYIYSHGISTWEIEKEKVYEWFLRSSSDDPECMPFHLGSDGLPVKMWDVQAEISE